MKKANRILALVLACAVLASGGALLASAETPSDDAAPAQTEPVVTAAAGGGSAAAEKNETVYVISGADGSVESVIVSDFLSNPDSAATLSDVSTLSDIKTVRGDAAASQSGSDVTWTAQGEDVYYQGTTDKAPPVSVKITYQLDGKDISPDALAGQSGHVTIRFDYTNNETATVDGREVHVPFAVLTGLMLDNDNFRNITVTNGKVLNDGSRSVVIGFALPGLQSDLALDPEDIELPEYVEISADCTDFSIETTLTLATSEVFAAADSADGALDTSELTDSLTALTDAMEQLMDGSSELYDGLATLLEKCGELDSGAQAIVDAAGQIETGAKSLSTGAGQLKSGASSLSSGLDQLAANNDTLTAGAKQVFDTLLATVQQQITASGLSVPALTIDNYAKTLDTLISSLDSSGVTAAAKAKVTEQVVSTVRPQVLAAVLASQGIDEQTYNALPAAQKSAIDAAVEQQMASNEVQAKIDAAVAQAMASDEVQSQIRAAASSAAAGVQQLTAAKAQLDSYNAFYQGLVSYTGGVASAATGAKQLVSGSAQVSAGADQLAAGASQLASGAGTLKAGTAALVDGVGQLKSGAMQLSDGLKQFNEEGIEKIMALADQDVIDGLQAVADAAKGYTNFSGSADGVTGTVRFIYKTASIG